MPAGSQALTLSALASTHFLAASSSDILSTAMDRATEFWSSLVHWNFLASSAAGLPELANFALATLLRSYGG